MTTEHKSATSCARPSKETAASLLQNSLSSKSESKPPASQKQQPSTSADPKTQGTPCDPSQMPLVSSPGSKAEDFNSSVVPGILANPDSRSNNHQLDTSKNSNQDKKRPEVLPIGILHGRKAGHLRFSQDSKEASTSSELLWCKHICNG